MLENISDCQNEAATCIDGYGEFFTSTTSFKHSFVIQRALEIAATEKRVSKTYVIMACLLGNYNLQRIINDFTEEDWNWVHDKNIAALRKRNVARNADLISKANTMSKRKNG